MKASEIFSFGRAYTGMKLTELRPSVLYLLISDIAPKVINAKFLVMKKLKFFQ